LNFTLEANDNSPIENACFVVKNWGNRAVSLKIDGKPIAQSKAFRYGFRDGVEGTDLMVFIEKRAVKPLKISVVSGKN
jgi:hypothetical protein